MTFKEIQDLIKMMDKSSLTEFSYKTETYEIKIKGQQQGGNTVYNTTPHPMHVVTSQPTSVSNPQPVPSVAEVREEKSSGKNLIEIKSPMVGTFYRSSAPDKPPFVSVGDTIQKGSVLCIIEAMKLFNEIESEFSGKIVKVMVEDASPVEYDQVMFLIEP